MHIALESGLERLLSSALERSMPQHLSYPKQCSMCGRDYNIEVENMEVDQWKHVQNDIWTAGLCPECYNTACDLE